MNCKPSCLHGAWRSALWGIAACLLVLWAGAAGSAPAPWYYWRSKVDGKRVCAQVSPGPGWERYGDPYDGPGCTARPRVFVIPAR
ncbi:MAG: hypothetical protein EOO33_03720 [Comamonadaceae bacterium]|nr:MAG: hypothetical protein EOO33_03720 [Comamonadaceae bacterium]